MTEAPWPVALFTRNGAGTIARALDSLAAARDGHALTVFVLANGCSDATAAVARGWHGDGVEIRVVEIALGDKANAWNAYVHDHAPDRPVHFFMDGDIEAAPGALRLLAEALRDPTVAAAGAVPLSGRDRTRMTERLIAFGRVAGALYALSGEFISRLRHDGVRLPVGWIGEDFLVSWIAKGGWTMETRDAASPRLAIVAAAGFRFRALSPWRPRDIAVYLRRLVRYELRTRQFHCLFVRSPELGLPEDVGELYARAPSFMRPHRAGIYTPIVLAATFLMRRAVARRRRMGSGPYPR